MFLLHRIEWETFDYHSGIHEVSWKIFDNFTNDVVVHGNSHEPPQGETKVTIFQNHKNIIFDTTT
jgi:hypothetical protein